MKTRSVIFELGAVSSLELEHERKADVGKKGRIRRYKLCNIKDQL